MNYEIFKMFHAVPHNPTKMVDGKETFVHYESSSWCCNRTFTALAQAGHVNNASCDHPLIAYVARYYDLCNTF